MSRISFSKGDPRKRIARYREAVRLGVTDAVTDATLLVERGAKQILTDLNKVDRGLLRSTISHQITTNGTTVEGTVYVGATYGVWVEFGRRGLLRSPPGMTKDSAQAAWPPASAIRAWVRRNHKKIGASVVRGRRLVRPDDAQERAAAFLIARKIARYGIAPSPFLRPAYNAVAPRFQAMISAAIARRAAGI